MFFHDIILSFSNMKLNDIYLQTTVISFSSGFDFFAYNTSVLRTKPFYTLCQNKKIERFFSEEKRERFGWNV